jgi:hypothetical protein
MDNCILFGLFHAVLVDTFVVLNMATGARRVFTQPPRPVGSSKWEGLEVVPAAGGRAGEFDLFMSGSFPADLWQFRGFSTTTGFPACAASAASIDAAAATPVAPVTPV